MKWDVINENKSALGHFLMAMHSSSETLGVALLDSRDPEKSKRCLTFPIGKKLSNSLLSCVAKLLPTKYWSQLTRIAVATGPGGFTGTRLTVVMARTLAQQLDCPLDGIGSFPLMAPRLAKTLCPKEQSQPFWIIKDLDKRGKVGGKYQVNHNCNITCLDQVSELEAPHLLGKDRHVYPLIHENQDVEADVQTLLEICLESHKIQKKSIWSDVLPIYPTSPVSNS